MDTSTRLPGHGLRNEGAPFEWSGEGDWIHVWGSWTGAGVCWCGAASEVLGSNNARKRWHKAHKDEIRDGGSRG